MSDSNREYVSLDQGLFVNWLILVLLMLVKKQIGMIIKNRVIFFRGYLDVLKRERVIKVEEILRIIYILKIILILFIIFLFVVESLFYLGVYEFVVGFY